MKVRGWGGPPCEMGWDTRGKIWIKESWDQRGRGSSFFDLLEIITSPADDCENILKDFTSCLIALDTQHSKMVAFLGSTLKDILMAKNIGETQRDSKIPNLHPCGPIYTVQLCRMQNAYDKSRTQVVLCKSNLQPPAWGCLVRHEECRGHVLKPYDICSHR